MKLMKPSGYDDSSRIGRVFAVIAWLAVLFVLYWWFSRFLDSQENPNQQVYSYRENGNAVVELRQNPAGHYLANGFIDNHKVSFLLDTGATQVAIPGRMATQMRMQQGQRIQVRTANGIATAYQTEIAELQIGEIRLYNVAATIVPDYDSPHVLLGMSALRELEFSQRDRVLTIRQ